MSTQNDNPTLGPTFTAHARQLLNRQNAKSAWPYPWIYPPAAEVPLTLYGGVAMPADSDPASHYPLCKRYPFGRRVSRPQTGLASTSSH